MTKKRCRTSVNTTVAPPMTLYVSQVASQMLLSLKQIQIQIQIQITSLHNSTIIADMERDEERRYLGCSEDFFSSPEWKMSPDWTSTESRFAQMALARCATTKGFLQYCVRKDLDLSRTLMSFTRKAESYLAQIVC